MNLHDRGLWEYFATLYKNSNKGIKGRGKDRRITPSISSRGAGSRTRLEHPNEDIKMHRSGYEVSSAYTASVSSDGEEMEAYCVRRV